MGLPEFVKSSIYIESQRKQRLNEYTMVQKRKKHRMDSGYNELRRTLVDGNGHCISMVIESLSR